MEPIRVSKITIQGVKGILKPIEVSLGKVSKPCSLAIFAPNACGKSGIADALEYFFNEKGEVDHLGIKGDSERGGKPALPHIHASKAKIQPKIALTFSDGRFQKPTTITRDVKTGTKDEIPIEIEAIIDSARAVRILRQHDLRRFVVDYEPSKKYEEISRWVGLKRLDDLRDQVIKAQNEFKKKNVDAAKQVRVKDISRQTDNKVSNFVERNITNWINDSLIGPLGLKSQIRTLAETKAVYDELDKLQAAEDKKLGISVFQHLLEIIHVTKDEDGKIAILAPFDFPEKIEELKSAMTKLEKSKQEVKDSLFKDVWEKALPLLDSEDLGHCPLCETKWQNTKYESRSALAEALKRNLLSLKALSDIEKTVAKAFRDVTAVLQADSRLLTSIKERALAAKLPIAEDIEKNFVDTLDHLLNATDAERCRSSKDIPQSTLWDNALISIEKEIESCVVKADREIEARGKEHPDRKRFHDAKKRTAEIIALKRDYEKLEAMQDEYDKAGDALAKISTAIRSAIKEQMKAVLTVLKQDITSIYKKINRTKSAPEIHIDVPEDKNASLNLRISFYDVKDPVPPGGYLSESYINTLGIAVFLAAVKNFNCSFPFVVLDDIISSYDADHRNYIVDVLAEDFRGFQVVITTHDHMFYRHLKQRLQDKNWRFKQIRNWNIDEGPHFHDELTEESEIEALFADKLNYNAAGNAVRVYMEEWFDRLCHELSVHTPHKRDMHDYSRTLFDFWTPFMTHVKSFGPAVKGWLEAQPCYDRLRSHQLINYYSHHQSNPYEWGDMADVEYIWNNFKEFKSLFVCQKCGGKLTYKSGEDKKPYCKKCGEWP
jgi:hypothetical protein